MLSLIIAWTILGSISLVFIDDYLENFGHGLVIDNAVEWWLEKASVIAIFVALFGIWYQRRENNLKERERHLRSCRSVLVELEGMEMILSDKVNNGQINVDNKMMVYEDVILSTDVYNSIIHSGLFTYFSIETQNELSGLYNRINIRNDLLLFLNRYDYSLPALNDDHLNMRWIRLANHINTLNVLESEIKELIKGTKILVETEMA